MLAAMIVLSGQWQAFRKKIMTHFQLIGFGAVCIALIIFGIDGFFCKRPAVLVKTTGGRGCQ